MYKDQEEKLTDIILGKAVMVLLKDDASINSANLLRLLQSMLAAEKEVARQQACRSAMEELRNYSSFETEDTGFDQPGSDAMSHLFTSDGPPDGTKKH